MSEAKEIPKEKKVIPDAPAYFTKMMKMLYGTLWQIHPRLGKLYVKFWKFINFCIIGGIGVLLNYLIWVLTISFMPWEFSNALAIAVATVWNYMNDVGQWAHYWGFTLTKEDLL